MVFFLLLWLWGFWVWRGVVPDWQDMAKVSSTDTVVSAKPVNFGCGARWGWNRLHWWNLNFSNTLCIRIRMILQCSYLRQALTRLRWLCSGGGRRELFGTQNVLSEQSVFSFFLTFPVCCWKAAVASHSWAGNHLLMSNPWYWHWSGPYFAM